MSVLGNLKGLSIAGKGYRRRAERLGEGKAKFKEEHTVYQRVGEGVDAVEDYGTYAPDRISSRFSCVQRTLVA